MFSSLDKCKVVAVVTVLVGLLLSATAATASSGKGICTNYSEAGDPEGSWVYAFCADMEKPRSVVTYGHTTRPGEYLAAIFTCETDAGSTLLQVTANKTYYVKKAGDFRRTFRFSSEPVFNWMFARYKHVMCRSEVRMVLPEEDQEDVRLRTTYR